MKAILFLFLLAIITCKVNNAQKFLESKKVTINVETKKDKALLMSGETQPNFNEKMEACITKCEIQHHGKKRDFNICFDNCVNDPNSRQDLGPVVRGCSKRCYALNKADYKLYRSCFNKCVKDPETPSNIEEIAMNCIQYCTILHPIGKKLLFNTCYFNCEKKQLK